jgi:polyhydroxyalkanoate synthesis regulator phasin
MPQPKKPASKATATRSAAARKATAKRSAAARKAAAQSRATSAKSRASGAKSRAAGTKSRASTSRPSAAKPAAAKPRARAASRAGSSQADDLRANLQSAVDTLAQGVLLTRERLQEVLDDAVGRGRMTPADANSLAQDLFKLGRKQTDELRKQAEALRSDLEQLLGRAGGDLHKRASTARRRAVRGPAADRALREVDRARRAAGLGRFPILNYEDLTAAQIAERLSDLSPAELRKVRDHERRNANRKSVLSAIEKALG